MEPTCKSLHRPDRAFHVLFNFDGTRAMMRMTGVAIGLALALGATSALGQSNPRYVQFRPSAAKGALYTPDSGPAPTVAFLAIHRTSNFMNMIGTRELAKRGFMVLGMNPRSDSNEAIVSFD